MHAQDWERHTVCTDRFLLLSKQVGRQASMGRNDSKYISPFDEIIFRYWSDRTAAVAIETVIDRIEAEEVAKVGIPPYYRYFTELAAAEAAEAAAVAVAAAAAEGVLAAKSAEKANSEEAEKAVKRAEEKAVQVAAEKASTGNAAVEWVALERDDLATAAADRAAMEKEAAEKAVQEQAAEQAAAERAAADHSTLDVRRSHSRAASPALPIDERHAHAHPSSPALPFADRLSHARTPSPAALLFDERLSQSRATSPSLSIDARLSQARAPSPALSSLSPFIYPTLSPPPPAQAIARTNGLISRHLALRQAGGMSKAERSAFAAVVGGPGYW